MILRVLEERDLIGLPIAQATLAALGASWGDIRGMKWAGEIHGRLAAVGGVRPVEPGVGEVWLELTPWGQQHPLRVARTIRDLELELLKKDFHRLQAIFDLRDPAVMRWLWFLKRVGGFQAPVTSFRTGIHGEHLYLYAVEREG